ncbi:MAG: transglycosylase [Calothrix sp. SM1_5_4]|nr:transglycosylase [Calothrix sp. SM1_5_4]
MRPVNQFPELSELQDDLQMASLISALEENIRILKERGTVPMSFGANKITSGEYAAALSELLREARQDPSGERFRALLREKFQAFEVYGDEEWGQVFITSYFEPVIEGSRKARGRFKQPLYGMPKDMVEVDIKSFASRRPALAESSGMLRGRVIASKNGPARVVAYPDRAQIQAEGLKSVAPILAWVDPVDAFFLEIQGSGVVKLDNGKQINVGYAGQNGSPYVPIGKFLLDKIPKEKMSQQAIEAHLRSLPEMEARQLMSMNPSYVFFRPLNGAGVTYFGSEVVPGRTIATDQTYFPKGALAFLQFDKPTFSAPTAREPAAWQPASRFVLDHDTGGAIRGPHRVDLFWGRGDEAKQSAGVMRRKGRLLYFAPKAALTATRNSSSRSRLVSMADDASGI